MTKKKNLPAYYSYAAIFERSLSGLWLVTIPDLDGCRTNASSLEEAIIQAHNILEDYTAKLEREGIKAPAPTSVEAVKVPPGGLVKRVTVSRAVANRRREDRSVNHMVTLPAWLDEKGRQADLNFSQLLQTAIMHELKLL